MASKGKEGAVSRSKELFISCYVKCMGRVREACNMAKIDPSTFYRWKEKDKVFWEKCLEEHKNHYKSFVDGKMYQKINGTTVTETIKEYDENGRLKGTKVITREIPPSDVLIKFWQQFKNSEEYKDKSAVDITSNGETVGGQVYVLPGGKEIKFD